MGTNQENTNARNAHAIDLKLFNGSNANNNNPESTKSALTEIQKVWDGNILTHSNSAFYDVTRMIILIMRFTGRYPYIKAEGRMSIKLVSLVMFASWAFFGLQCFIAYSEFPRMIRNTFFNKDFDISIMSGMYILLVIFQIILPLTAWVEWPALCDYFNHWKDFEVELKNKTGIELERGLAKVLFSASLIELPGVIYLGYSEAGIFAVPSWAYTILVFGIIQINLHMYLYLWVFSCVFIGKASDSLLKYVLKVTKGDVERIKASELATCRLLWLRMAELSIMLADTLAPTMLFSFLVCGISFVMSSYALLYSIRFGGYNEHTWSYVCFLVITCTVVVAICDSAHRTTYKVGHVFSSEIMKIDSANLGNDSRKELDFLINTIGTNPPELMFAGFFTINRHLFVSFLSSTVTYLIVMVQFRATEDNLIYNIQNSSIAAI